MVFFYLHGWASSPASSKAQYFQQGFAALNLPLHLPDLNQPDFYHLTLTRQIQQVASLLPETPVTIIGSSLGGLTALWLAERCPQVERLVLLAPALNFAENCRTVLTEAQLQQWRTQQELEIFHYAYEKPMLLHYNFISDRENYPDSGLRRELPTLILHGKDDAVIPVKNSHDFARTRPWVKLQVFESDHGLNNVQAELWDACQQFCDL
ncbi:MAG: hypothetical protein RIS84_1512 [Pseudomonadota bacterium]|jgi:hypothetical protein